MPLVDANFDEVSVWYVSHHVVPNQWVFNFRIFLFGEVSVKKCSPVISVVAGSIDRPHLAADSKNNQEESQPCCHLGCGWSSVFRWCFWLLTHFTQVGIGAMMLLLVSETGQMVRAQKPRVCTCKVYSDWLFGFKAFCVPLPCGQEMAIFSITTLPITIAKNNQFVQSPILTESPNSTTAPARRRWRNIPISWEWSLCLQTILGDNHCRDFRYSAKQQITRDSFHGLYRGADATMGRDVGSKKRWRWCSRRDLEVGSHLIAVECCTL